MCVWYVMMKYGMRYSVLWCVKWCVYGVCYGEVWREIWYFMVWEMVCVIVPNIVVMYSEFSCVVLSIVMVRYGVCMVCA